MKEFSEQIGGVSDPSTDLFAPVDTPWWVLGIPATDVDCVHWSWEPLDGAGPVSARDGVQPSAAGSPEAEATSAGEAA